MPIFVVKRLSTFFEHTEFMTNTTQTSPYRKEKLAMWIESQAFQFFIVGLIVINACLLGLETSSRIMGEYGSLIRMVDGVILCVFVLELAARMLVYKKSFWRDPWSLFDFTVVFIALIPATGPFAIVRALRVLRVLRLLTMVPSMQRVVGALLSAIPGLGSIACVLLIFYYVAAVMATHFFGSAYPEWFGDIGRSLYTLFQIMTLESWSMGISRPVMEQFPYAWAFFIPFILIATFTMLNLFIAIIVNAMQRYSESTEGLELAAEKPSESSAMLEGDIQQLRKEIAELKSLLQAVPQGNTPTKQPNSHV